MAKRAIVFIFIFLFFSSTAFTQEKSHEVPRLMKTAGFWIGQHPAPDVLMMDPAAIVQFNEWLRTSHLTKDIFTISPNTGLRYGLVVHFANQRFLPTNKGLDSNDFDPLQNSGLDVGTPVAVVRTSADGLWYYVLTDISDGWVEVRNIALGELPQVAAFAQSKDFIVATAPKADIFLNGTMTKYYDYVRMGVRLPMSAMGAGEAIVFIPTRAKDGALIIKPATMNAQDVHAGFLPYTPRTIYKQALMMLNEPYGWGDRNGEQDCSRFLQMVFATVGIVLPRDSKPQTQADPHGIELEKSDNHAKIMAIFKAPPAATLLALKGHIMLYLGTVDDTPYVIHETTVGNFNRVIISDLSLGKGTPKGSLLSRLIRTVTIE